MTQPSSPSAGPARGPLAEIIVALAGTPDDVSCIDVQLDRLVRLAADTITAADYASVTAVRDGVYSTVAASSALATAVDRAQYADDDGPCLQALDQDTPVAVRDASTTMRWPGFRDAARRMGLRASVSIPVFTGSGAAVAALNLYGRATAAMAPLIVGVCAVYDPDRPMSFDDLGLPPLDPGGEDLLAGFAEALEVRATIQLALGCIMARTGTAQDAYVDLRLRAVETGASLLDAANAVIIGASTE
jgi:hypothetical protein